jgi:hypothetical protein
MKNAAPALITAKSRASLAPFLLFRPLAFPAVSFVSPVSLFQRFTQKLNKCLSRPYFFTELGLALNSLTERMAQNGTTPAGCFRGGAAIHL